MFGRLGLLNECLFAGSRGELCVRDDRLTEFREIPFRPYEH